MIEMVRLLIRNCPICSSRLDTTNIITMEQENDMEILNMLYGEKHGNVSSPSLELSSICKNEIQTVHETDQECPMKQNSADEKSCIMSNEPDKERNEENERVLENMDNNGVEICNLESNEEPDYFWHSVRLFNMSFTITLLLLLKKSVLRIFMSFVYNKNLAYFENQRNQLTSFMVQPFANIKCS